MYKVETLSGIFAIKLLNADVIKSEYGVANHILAETISEITKESHLKPRILQWKTLLSRQKIIWMYARD